MNSPITDRSPTSLALLRPALPSPRSPLLDGLILAGAFASVIASSLAQNAALEDTLWQSRTVLPQSRSVSDQRVHPQRYRIFELNPAVLHSHLDLAPREFSLAAEISPGLIELPMPDGLLATFRFMESPVMAPELAARHPDIRTYSGVRVDDPVVTARFDFTPFGLHAYIRTREGPVFIEPLYHEDAIVHAVFSRSDQELSADDWQCYTATSPEASAAEGPGYSPLSSGTHLRTYRLACAGTGEWTQFHGGTVKAGLAAVVTVVNRLNAIYEAELAIRFVLAANNDQIIYTNPATDPYTGNDASALLGENQANLDAVIGNADYDLGHVLSMASGGLAHLYSVCNSGSKARAQTGRGSGSGDSFFVDYVAHEIGHQFGARHSFNGTRGTCGENRDASTAYEPGSGSTILSYAGNCLGDNVTTRSDLYFHGGSLDQIIQYSTTGAGASCAAVNATGNRLPVVSAGPDFTIPKGTPFVLTATGSDPDGDEVTFCWEEMDLGPATTLSDPDNGSSPLFRSVRPSTDPSRVFPNMQSLLNNSPPSNEKLPTTTRTLKFRVTARDNRAGGGGVSASEMQVSVIDSAGPLAITSHNSGGSFSNNTTVTWNVSGTAASPINAAHVNLWLSTDNGQTFTIPLALHTPNDGSETVTLPNISITTARLKLEAVGNIFFDVCDAQFTILPVPPVPVLTIRSTALASESCAPVNGSIDAGETVTVNFTLRNNVLTKTTNLVATLLPTGGVTAPGAPQAYGAMNGGQLVTKPFTFTAGGICGGSITATLQLQDNALDLGTISTTLNLGAVVSSTVTRQNNTPLTLPAGGTTGPASLYPSTVEVNGVTGGISQVRVTLTGLTHSFAGDLDVLLVSPTGRSVMLMSDAGNGTNISSATLTFDDTASSLLVSEGRIVTGTNQPTNYDPDSDNFASPAPPGPYGQTLSVLNGLEPNGTWSLYINDDSPLDTGTLGFGWRLYITTTNLVCCGSAPNTAPSLSSIADQTVHAGALVVVTNAATDAESPPQTLTFGFASAPPPTASLHPVTGLFQWLTTDADAGTTNTILVRVTDDGIPPESATNSYRVVVLSRPIFQAITVTNNAARLEWSAIPGQRYRVQQKADLGAATWSNVATEVLATGSAAFAVDALGSTQRRFYRVLLLP